MDEGSLITRYIEPDPYRLGPADVRLKDSGVHVWAIVGDYLFDAAQDTSVVSHDYGVPVEAVLAALAYYRHNKAAIDVRLAENGATVP